MRVWYNNVVDTQRRLFQIEGERIRIGRDPNNDLVLHSPYVARQAAVLNRQAGSWDLLVLGLNGLKVIRPGADPIQLGSGERFRIESSISIELFPFNLTLDLPRADDVSRDAARARLDLAGAEMLAAVHRELLDRMELRRDVDKEKRNDQQFQLVLERHLETITRQHPTFQSQRTALIDHLAGCTLRDQLLDSRQATEQDQYGQSNGSPLSISPSSPGWAQIVTSVPDREQELTATVAYLQQVIASRASTAGTYGDGPAAASPVSAESPSAGPSASPPPSRSIAPAPLSIEVVDQAFWPTWSEVNQRVHEDFKEYLALRKVKKDIKDILFGYGPLEDLLRLSSVSEIMVVDRERIFVESHGVLQDSGRSFPSDEVVESIIQRIVGQVGRRIDQSQPLVDARLRDGSRVNAVIAPLAVSGPTLTIRKFPVRRITVADLIALEAIPQYVSDFLKSIVISRRNVLISGGTGSGKTTLLNCLSDFIPDEERIITVEDTAELQLTKRHVVRMETKDANVEGAGEYTIRDLVRNALRMRPDRLVVGECRGSEALDMLQAMNTGHDGSLTTIHANSPQDVIPRLEVLVQMAADLPVASIRQQIASAIDVIVQLQRLRDGRRIVSQITECVQVDPMTQQIELRDLYILDRMNDSLQATGCLPTFIAELLSKGRLNLETFYSKEPTCSQ